MIPWGSWWQLKELLVAVFNNVSQKLQVTATSYYFMIISSYSYFIVTISAALSPRQHLQRSHFFSLSFQNPKHSGHYLEMSEFIPFYIQKWKNEGHAWFYYIDLVNTDVQSIKQMCTDRSTLNIVCWWWRCYQSHSLCRRSIWLLMKGACWVLIC